MRRSRSPIRYRRVVRSRSRSRPRSYDNDVSTSNDHLHHSYKRLSDDQTERRTSKRREGAGSSRSSRDQERDERRSDRHSYESKKRKDSTSRTRNDLKFEERPERSTDKITSMEAAEENYLDPSICNFDNQRTFQYEHVSEDRLDRLEKQLEALLNRKANESVEAKEGHSGSDSFEFIPRNTGFTTSMWLNKLQEECIKNDFDEKTSIMFVQSKMSGIMKAWSKTLDLFEYSLPELKLLITKTFPDNTDFASTLRLLVNRFKQADENYTQYYYSKMYLIEACKITGPDAVSCLIDGIDDYSVCLEAKSHNFLAPETLYSQFLMNVPEPMTEPTVESSSEIATHRDIELYVEPKFDLKKGIKKCFTCHKTGHKAADCRHAPFCYKCNGRGHIAAKCHF